MDGGGPGAEVDAPVLFFSPNILEVDDVEKTCLSAPKEKALDEELVVGFGGGGMEDVDDGFTCNFDGAKAQPVDAGLSSAEPFAMLCPPLLSSMFLNKLDVWEFDGLLPFDNVLGAACGEVSVLGFLFISVECLSTAFLLRVLNTVSSKLSSSPPSARLIDSTLAL